jgi:multiphosphoryl transfer protein
MLELTIEQISMGQTAVDKSAALQLLAEKLVADGLVAEGYLSGLQAREAQGSTFLGQGIAIPHGTPETRDLVFTTGVRLLHFPKAWIGAMARSCTWRLALRPSPMNTCACCNC